MAGDGDQGLDSSQLKTSKSKHDAHKKKSAAPAPKDVHAAPASSVDMLRAFVDDTTSTIAPLKGDVDHTFAGAQRIINTAAEYIASRMPAVQSALTSDPGDVEQVTDLMALLDKQLNILLVVARRHKVPLRGNLERVFDGEDNLCSIVRLPRYGRADSYYDDDLGTAAEQKNAKDPTSDTLNSGESTGEKAHTRKQLIAEIQSFGIMVTNAMQSGLQAARDIISEPDAPDAPKLLEVIADAALDFALSAATGGVGTLIKSMMKMPNVAKAAKEIGNEGAGEEDGDLGHEMIEALADSVKEAGKGAIKPTIKVMGADGEDKKEGDKDGKKDGEGEAHDNKLSVKTIYFQVADDKTRKQKDATISNYNVAASGRLLRMPVTSLQALASSFSEDLKTRIKEEVTSRLVDGWVVFGKQSGQYAGDPSKRPSKSKLEAPYGICEIWLTANADASHFSLTWASLPYQTDAVLANIQQQKGNLADLPIARSIRVLGMAYEPFDVDEKGQVDAAATKQMSTDELVNFANFASARERKGGNLEASALAGMYKVLQMLNSIPRSRITESRV